MSEETAINKIIEKIIKDRQKKVEKLRIKRDEITAVEQSLQQLLEKGAAAVADKELCPMLERNPWLKALLERPHTIEECLNAYQTAHNELDFLISRFNRNSVNISVVGDSRAGKSRFLQTVSGLNNHCIPSFPGSFCTGVSSVIENDSSISDGDVKGVFTFKTEAEILKEINDKFNQITGKAFRFHALSEIGAQSPEAIKREMEANAKSEEKGLVSDFLTMYITNFKVWSSYINENREDNESRVITNPAEIQQYVAKHDGGTDGTDARPFYRYIAVKKAEIYCNFKLTDVNQLRLVDTVGLGDLASGTTEKMYEAIDRDSDAVLYFFRPQQSHGGMMDKRTYDILNRQIYPRYRDADTKWWMGIVVNDDGTNRNECVKFLEGLEQKAVELAQNVVFKEIINVSKEADVRRKSVQPLLESLSRHLGAVDQRLEAAAKARLSDANQALALLKQNCFEVCVPVPEDIISSKFSGIISQFIDDIRGLGARYQRDEDNLQDNFLEESLQKIRNLWTKPTEEGRTITSSICQPIRYATEPTSMHSRAFGELQRIVRNIGSRESSVLDQIEKDFKKELANDFLKSFQFERSRCPLPDSDTFFLEMAEQLFGSTQEFAMLKDAFLSLHAFKLNETKGMVKLIFNEKADLYLGSTANTGGRKVKPGDPDPEAGQIPKRRSLPEETLRQEDSKTQLPEDTGTEVGLVAEMNHQLELFEEDIREVAASQLSYFIPISRQILFEIRFFLRFFDFCYHREWSDVLNRQLREGYVFAEDKRIMDDLSIKFVQFKEIVAQATSNIFIPQDL